MLGSYAQITTQKALSNVNLIKEVFTQNIF